jgi:hypothetical protein
LAKTASENRHGHVAPPSQHSPIVSQTPIARTRPNGQNSQCATNYQSDQIDNDRHCRTEHRPIVSKYLIAEPHLNRQSSHSATNRPSKYNVKNSQSKYSATSSQNSQNHSDADLYGREQAIRIGRRRSKATGSNPRSRHAKESKTNK